MCLLLVGLMKQFSYKDDLNRLRFLKIFKIVAFTFVSAMLYTCGKDDLSVKDFIPYEGPISIIDNIELTFSDSAKIRVQLIAKKQLEFTNGDREFPEGIFIEFYNKDEILETTLEANSGSLDGETNIYTGTGDVKINNLLQNKSLFTEELHWDPSTEKIFTDRNVIIIQDGEKITGTGMEASQDFETYEIKNPKGSFAIESEDEVI